MIGIYKIESIKFPNRVYYGRTIDYDKRKYSHIKLLEKNKHHSIKLQNHFNKYGLNDLTFTFVESCEKDKLIDIEQTYIDNKNYFNISNSSKGGRENKKSIISILKTKPILERLNLMSNLIDEGNVEVIKYWLFLRYGNPIKN